MVDGFPEKNAFHLLENLMRGEVKILIEGLQVFVKTGTEMLNPLPADKWGIQSSVPATRCLGWAQSPGI